MRYTRRCKSVKIEPAVTFSLHTTAGAILARYNAYSYLGSDAPDVVESGRSQDSVFQENTIIGGIETLKIMDADGTQFFGDSFEDAVTIRFDDATRTVMSGNTGLNGTKLKVQNGASFDRKSDFGFEPTYRLGSAAALPGTSPHCFLSEK